MKTETTYILNPCYFLHNDVNRCQIGAYDEPRYSDIKYTEGCLINIHPLVAQMLSFFDGKQDLDNCIECIAQYFQLTYSDVSDIIGKYIENDVWLKNSPDIFYAPENVLIPKEHYERTEYYDINDFPLPGIVDLNTVRNNKPTSAIFELTMKCYTDCIYCYADRHNPASEHALSIDEIKRLIRQFKSYDIKSLTLNGGEVLLHPNIKDILREMKELGYFSFISTKYPIQEEMIKFLKETGFTKIQISIDSLNARILSHMLRVDASYLQKITKTMQMLDEMEFEWSTNSIMTRVNCIPEEIEKLVAYLTSFKNIRRISFSEAGYSLYKDNAQYQQIKPTLNSIKEAEGILLKYREKFPDILFRIPSPTIKEEFCLERKTKDFDGRALCTANQRLFVILPDGKVTICEELYWHPQFIIGDLRKNSIAEIWEGEKARQLFNIAKEQISQYSVCKQCDSFNDCRHVKGVCWKMILEAYGMEKWDYPDPRCRFAPPLQHPIYLE